MHYDVVIVGAGPAGLFAARELALHSKMKVIVVDMGREVANRKCMASDYKACTKCNPCSIMCGVGGAGTLSSGLLNLRPDIGGNLYQLLNNEKAAWELVKYVDDAFLEAGAPTKIYTPNEQDAADLERRAASVGVRFIPIVQRHIGSDNAPRVIEDFSQDLRKRDVQFTLLKRVTKLEEGTVVFENGEKLEGDYVLVAPGRCGASWLASEARRLNIPSRYQPIDIGVRVEVPQTVMGPVIGISRDPKFHIAASTYDDFVRTFCVNHRGFVVQEVYDDFIGVNGHAMTEKLSDNSNFAFLVRIELTEPLEDTTSYGRTIAMQTTTLGGGKPLLQRLRDLKTGHRSTWDRVRRGTVKPTLINVTPGDIAMGLPHRIVTDLIEGLDKLDRVIPGVAQESTLLYAPEVKFSANRIYTNPDLETPVKNLFVAGDGAGLSGGLVVAAATGVIAARGILKKSGNMP
ncbi:NAD(P)/FAD-dependent oxidoreductase [Candidatus Bathyarchaeota archaeon]|nr:NAD(P)/FAD-dependent oxidoreductase [Candidatus Bathyarchaeota archaeon]